MPTNDAEICKASDERRDLGVVLRGLRIGTDRVVFVRCHGGLGGW